MFLRSLAKKKTWYYLLYIILMTLAAYPVGRLYFRVTDGFTETNISFELPYQSDLVTRRLTPEEHRFVDAALDQHFHYLGKGCQCYVFESNDGCYVVKFFKYQRFKPKLLLELFSFIPSVDRYRAAREKKKQEKLHSFMKGCQVAFDHLQDETGLLYVQLNKIPEFKKKLTIYDKLGFEHTINLDRVEFIVQRKARMFSEEIDALMSKGEKEGAGRLITAFVDMLFKEYERGLADNDPAFLQNTGVLEGKPVHIDVGQFTKFESIGNRQGLLDKVDELRKWVGKTYPELLIPLEQHLSH